MTPVSLRCAHLDNSLGIAPDRVRFSWQAGGASDAPLFFAGTDFATIAEDGRFRSVTGFIDAMPHVG